MEFLIFMGLPVGQIGRGEGVLLRFGQPGLKERVDAGTCSLARGEILFLELVDKGGQHVQAHPALGILRNVNIVFCHVRRLDAILRRRS